MSVLTAFYDLEYGPVSFDFCPALVRAAVEQVRLRCQRLHVVVVPKEDGVGGFARDWGGYDAAAAQWRLWHIVAALAPLAGATLAIAPTRRHAEAQRLEPSWWPQGKAHLLWPLIAHAKAGGAIPLLRATAAARGHIAAWLAGDERPIVTLTTRKHGFGPTRNTNAEAWRRMADWLGARGCRVIELADTARALAAGRGHAELDVDLRLALYERAAMNLIGHNGPVSLLWFSAAPYLCFDSARGADNETLSGAHGFVPGSQLPWALAYQRQTWLPDDFTAMRQEYERWAGATN